MDLSSLFGQLAPGALGLYGYDQQMENLDTQRERMLGTQQPSEAGYFGDTQAAVTDALKFNPYTVKSSVGRMDYGDDGTTQMTLNPRGLAYQNQNLDNSMSLLNRASESPLAREQSIYEEMRAMQAPEEQRQYDTMNQNLFSSGRGGMSVGGYGGTPEQHAFGLAQAEARNKAALGAKDFAQKELRNQYEMGSGMGNVAYNPLEALLGATKVGMGNQEMAQRSQLDNASYLAQLGLGAGSLDANYAKIQQQMFGDLISGLSGPASAIGGAIGGGLEGLLSQIIGSGGGGSADILDVLPDIDWSQIS